MKGLKVKFQHKCHGTLYIHMGANLELLEQFPVCSSLRVQVEQEIWAKSDGWARKFAISSTPFGSRFRHV